MNQTPADPRLDDSELTVADVVYANPLNTPSDVAEWRMEGPGVATFPLQAMRLESTGATEAGQKSNLVFWCPEVVPDNVRIRWQFRPIMEPGLAILFFAARGRGGQHVLDDSLAARSGPYDQYHSGDINALHISYFRRRSDSEIRCQVCNLRKSHGFHLVAQGGDPIPSVAQADGWYQIAVIKSGPLVRFCIEDVVCFTWRDDGVSHGDVLADGSIGFRQMNPLIAEYRDLVVERLEERQS